MFLFLQSSCGKLDTGVEYALVKISCLSSLQFVKVISSNHLENVSRFKRFKQIGKLWRAGACNKHVSGSVRIFPSLIIIIEFTWNGK